jgi:hypothetical protein
VTLATILSKLVLMGVLMTVGAAGKRNIGKLLVILPIHYFHLMAFNTFNTGVFSKQGKSCPGVIKIGCRFK